MRILGGQPLAMMQVRGTYSHMTSILTLISTHYPKHCLIIEAFS